MTKRRAMTPEERERLDRLCYKAKLGQLESSKEIMTFFTKMFAMDPEGYEEVANAARKRAVDDFVAPFRRRGERS